MMKPSPDASRLLMSLIGEAKGKKRRPTQATWRNASLLVFRRMNALNLKLRRDAINATQWYLGMRDVLHEGHSVAGALGRQRAGDLTPRSVVDELWGAEAMQQEIKYLGGFYKALQAKDKRYYDEFDKLKIQPVKSRQFQYVQKLRGTANASFANASAPEMLFDWVMLNSEHCSVCPGRQANSPYTKLTLPSHPGDGSTPCRSNCGCVLVRHDGVIGFARVFDEPPQIDDMPDLFAPPDDADSLFIVA